MNYKSIPYEQVHDKYSEIGTMYDPRVGKNCGLWMFFFGGAYLLYKGNATHFFLWCFTAWLIIPHIVYVIFARSIVYNGMEKKGYLR